jgi:hypothetical protein
MGRSLSDCSPAEFHAREAEALDLLRKHFRGWPPLQLEIGAVDLLVLLSQLQLALRHPTNVDESARWTRKFVDSIITTLSAGDVEIAVLLRRGDDPAYDIPEAGVTDLSVAHDNGPRTTDN